MSIMIKSENAIKKQVNEIYLYIILLPMLHKYWF
jgi:hypothetical protein